MLKMGIEEVQAGKLGDLDLLLHRYPDARVLVLLVQSQPDLQGGESMHSQRAAQDPTPLGVTTSQTCQDQGRLPRRAVTERIVQRLVDRLGVPPQFRGYRYITEAVVVLAEEWPAELPVTKVVYPVVAKRFGTTAPRVERAIRHAVGVLWDRFHDRCAGVLGEDVMREGRPSNSKMLYRILWLLCEELRGG